MTTPVSAPSATDVAAMADTYTRWGWKVFPLWWVIPVVDGGPARCACETHDDRRAVGDPPCTSPGKHPIARLRRPGGGVDWLAPHGVKDASSDPTVVARWWSLAPQANIGLPAHDNGLAIIDIDPRHQGDRSWWRLLVLLIDEQGPHGWPTTVVQTTGSGGEHHLFAAPEGGIASTKRAFGDAYPGLDTRGRGGYVVAAPSRHASGGVYAWAPGSSTGLARDFMRRHILDEDTPERPLLTPWPRSLARLAQAAPATVGEARTALDIFATRQPRRVDPEVKVKVERGIPGATNYVKAAVTAELDRVRTAPEGGRNDQVNRAGYALGRFVAAGRLDEQRAYALLHRAALDAGLDPAEVPKTVLSGLANGKLRPILAGDLSGTVDEA